MARLGEAGTGRDKTSIHETLAAYVTLSYPIFPCKNGEKVPVTDNGLKDATTDPLTIRQWLAEHPAANWGLLPAGSVLVLDADTPAAAGQLEQDYPELTGAPKSRTPRGGAHFYLRWPDGVQPPPTRAKALPDVDLRGLGKAYLLVPPSRTANGTYRWERALCTPADLPTASEALVAALTPARTAPTTAPRQTVTPGTPQGTPYARAALQREHDAVAAAPVGQRNDTLNRAAFALGQLVASGVLTTVEVTDALMAAAGTCGLPHHEAQRTISSGLQAGQQQPRTPPAKPLQTASHVAGVFASFSCDGNGDKARPLQVATSIWDQAKRRLL